MDEYLKIYLPKDKNHINKIWHESIVVLDTNILLNLYRYTKGTREEFLKILIDIREKTWIPHQVAIEYLTNRTNVILEQEKDFTEQSEAIHEGKNVAVDKINEKLNSIKKPFRKIDLEEIKDRIDVFFEKLIKDVVTENENTVDFNENDIILRDFKRIFKDRIGPAYEEVELEDIYSSGEKRYKDKQPPGYEDLQEKKGEYRLYKDTTIKSEYGDLIVWKQIIDKAKKDNKSVIFITDDRKPDWWKEVRGQIKGPRVELLNEFFHETKNEILMYSTESFLRNANKILNVTIHKDTLKEVHDFAEIIKRRNRTEHREYNEIVHGKYEEYKGSNNHIKKIKNRENIYLLDSQIESIDLELYGMEFELATTSLNTFERKEHKHKIDNLHKKRYNLIMEKKMLEQQYLNYNGKRESMSSPKKRRLNS